MYISTERVQCCFEFERHMDRSPLTAFMQHVKTKDPIVHPLLMMDTWGKPGEVYR